MPNVSTVKASEIGAVRAVISRLKTLLVALLLNLNVPASFSAETVKATMDNIVTRIYATLERDELAVIGAETMDRIVTDGERQVLATKYWHFDVNVPVTVSVMRHNEQQITPFWLSDSGFQKTKLTVQNEHYLYEVWQRNFEAGRVELGINGFDRHRPHYFVAVGPRSSESQLEVTNFFPAKQTISTMRAGSLIYHDWTELVLTEVPDSLEGQLLLTTIRGRSREAHLIGAFRMTKFPSSEKPDLISLTWSQDPRTSQTISWRTNVDVPDGIVQFREANDGPAEPFKEVDATCTKSEDRLLCNDRYCHRFEAIASQLKPATTYLYRVGSRRRDSWSALRTFTTAPSGDAPFTFAYLGDTHRSPIAGQLLATALRTHPQSAFCMISGDLVDTGLYRDEWDQFFQYMGSFLGQRPVVPAIGNHDDQEGLGAAMYLSMFALPTNGPSGIERERAYHFRYGNALFAILDISSPLEPQAVWLEHVLSKTDAQWKFMMFHFPPYALVNEYEDLGDRVTRLCDRYHVDVVMTGHVHYYMRTRPMKGGRLMSHPASGTTYITSVAVPSREAQPETPKWAATFLSGPPLYQTFQINGRRCVYQALDLQGRVRDRMVIQK
jgi:hypothetical protein